MQQPDAARRSRARYPEPIRAYAAMNAVRALERLSFAPLTTLELADSLQIGTRTARRLLQRLVLEGFVAQDRGHRGRYRATLRLAVLGRQMVDHEPLVQAATPRVVRLVQDTSCVPHLWIPAYDEQVVGIIRADPQVGWAMLSFLGDVVSAPSSAAGTVLLRAGFWSSCYARQAGEPAFAAAVLEKGRVVGALGLTGDAAFEASSAAVTAAARLSAELGPRRSERGEQDAPWRRPA